MDKVNTLTNKIVSEDTAREMTVCLGCKRSKDVGLVVCWGCFKGMGTTTRPPYKYYPDTLTEWLNLK